MAKRSHAVFTRALDLDDRDRDEFIAAQCAGDPMLRAHVAKMLSAASKSGAFLEKPALSPSRIMQRGGTPVLPERIGDYRIVRVLGTGGMATVYEAEQQQPRRTVALKIMRRALAHTSAQQRFRFETEVLAKLQHPGIAQIYEAGTFDESPGVSLPYFAMEYIPDATTITAYAKSHSLSIRDRLLLFLNVCDAVQHGHQLGVVHRDLKPGNILVQGSQSWVQESAKASPTSPLNPEPLPLNPKIIDFGVARSTDPSQAGITQDSDTGRIIGTLNYMSPEQCVGGREIDTRTDVYSLGVVLYELACGQLPHHLASHNVPEALRVIQEDQPARPATLSAQLRGDIDAIITRAIEKNPNRRYPTVAALADDIRRHLRCETIEARPPTLRYRTARFVRRHRVLVIATTLTALAIMVGATVSVMFALHAYQESRDRRAAQQLAIEQRDAARRESYIGNIAAAIGAVRADEFPHARTRLRAAPEELRGWEWRYLNATVDPGDRTIGTHDDMIYAFSATADGKRIATGSRDGVVKIWTVDTGAVSADSERALGTTVHSLSFTRDGAVLVGGLSDGTVRLWDASSAAPLRILGRHNSRVGSVSTAPGGLVVSTSSDGVVQLFDLVHDDACREIAPLRSGIHGAAFSADGARLITWSARGPIELRDAMNPDQVLLRVSLDSLVYQAVLSPDGAMLAAGGSEAALMVWDARTGELLHNFTNPSNPSGIRSVAFSPSGQLLASGTHRNVVVHSLITGQVLRQHRGHEEAVSGVLFTPDGRCLYSASWDRTVRTWDIDSAAAAPQPVALLGHTDDVLSVTFSPDSSRIASGGRDRTIRLWDAARGEQVALLRGHKRDVSSVAFSPDGNQLLSGSYDATLRLWDVRSGEPGRVLSGHRDDVWSVAFASDGSRIASGSQDRTARVWDPITGETLFVLAGHSARVNAVAFDPQGRQLATASRDHSVRLWDATTGAALTVLNGHTSDVWAVSFSKDGRHVYSGSRDQTVRVWSVATGECLHVLGGHGELIYSLAVLADGTRLAGGSWFGGILLWDARSFEQIASFKADARTIRGLAFSPDARWLAMGSSEGSVRLFDAWPVAQRHAIRLAAEHSLDGQIDE